jgi:DNA-binding IclR family transcriptional regulator
MLEVDRDRALAGVLGQERDPQVLAAEARVGAELPCQVSGPGHLDLDHVRPEKRQLVARERAGEHVGHIEDADAL